MLQRKIILNASQYVKPGGVLVYSTCTLSTEENEDVVSWLINTNNNMKLEGFEEMLPEGYKNQGGNEGYIKLFPYKNNCDGFFIARFRKEG